MSESQCQGPCLEVQNHHMSYKVFVASAARSEDDAFLAFAPRFYQMFPHDHGLDVELPVITLPEPTMLSLLVQIKQAGHRDILIVTHANRNGLDLMLSPQKDQWRAVTMLLHLARWERVYETVKNKTNPAMWFELYRLVTADYEMRNAEQAHRTMLPRRQSGKSRQFEQEVQAIRGSKNRTDAEKAKLLHEKVEQVRKKFQERKRWARRDIGLPEHVIDSYLVNLRAVHRLRIRNVEIRGCDIGQNNMLLWQLLFFFGAESLSALRVGDRFGDCVLEVVRKPQHFNRVMNSRLRHYLGPTQDIARYGGGRYVRSIDRQRGEAFLYQPQGARHYRNRLIFIRVRVRGRERSQATAAHADAARQFFNNKFGRLAANRQLRLLPRVQIHIPVQYTETSPFYFPQDSRFGRYISRISSGYRYPV